jgi:hypothetical protein
MMNTAWLLSLVIIALLVGCEKSNELVFPTAQKTVDPTSRTVHEPDLESLTKRVMTAKFTVDLAFTEFISHSSPYYTDLYGVHALKDFTSEKIVNDFIPTSADLITQNNTTVELRFHSGWNATFYPHSILVVKNARSSTDHVYLGGNNAQEVIEHLTEFRDILKRNNLESTYPIENPYYYMEKQVDSAFYSSKPTVTVTTDSTMVHFQIASKAILIYPDPVHGDLPYYMQFLEALKTADIHWLGMEMMPSSMQRTIDSFCIAPTDSAEYIDARHNLTSYFLNAWTPYFRLNISSGEDSPYFKAVDLMRQKKGRVYGLDFDSIDFLLFRYGESGFGASVRSLNWANSVSTEGRGIVFGGSSHFTSVKPINMQDFLVARDFNIKLFSVRPLSNSAESFLLGNKLSFYQGLVSAVLLFSILTSYR